MDQFDDLPDVVDKDDKPRFLTEVHSTGNAAGNYGDKGPYGNGLWPLFDDDSSAKQEADN